MSTRLMTIINSARPRPADRVHQLVEDTGKPWARLHAALMSATLIRHHE